MTVQLIGRPGESVTARRVPVDVLLDIVQGIPADIRIHIRPDVSSDDWRPPALPVEPETRDILAEYQREHRTKNLLRQLLSEALAIVDENDPDHDAMNIRDWLRQTRIVLESLRRV